MAMVMDQQQQQQPQQQQQAYKHYCRICKKGFGCGRALGGHMRAHGINDDSGGSGSGSGSGGGGNAEQDDDPSGEWGPDEFDHHQLARSPPNSNKRMYALRTNPNRLKSCRVCENCGKEFVSWKSFLEHGKCSSEDEADDSYFSPPMSDDEEGQIGHRCGGWSKGKRSRRASYKSVVAATPISALCPSSSTTEEEDLANCLMLLSSARVDPILVEPEESCASASRDEEQWRHHHRPITNVEKSKAILQVHQHAPQSHPVPKGMFECKACKKVFTSHQALGGHRASHKKVKGCFAAKLDDHDDPPPEEDILMTTYDHNAINTGDTAAAAMAMAIVPFSNAPLAVAPLKKKSKVHECSICHRQFASGQALGGHKRCHWITSNSGAGQDPNLLAAKLQHHQHSSLQAHHGVGSSQQQQQQHHHHHHQELTLRPMFDASETLDLNLPAPTEAVRQATDIGSPLQLDMPTTLHLQPWVDQKNKAVAVATATDVATSSKTNDNNNKDNNNNENEVGYSVSNNNVMVDDEVESRVKLAKLNELKDINVGGGVSPWLQVGIGSTGNEASD